MLPAETQKTKTLETFLLRLHESHEVSVYEAVDRLVQAGEAVGLDAGKLMRMLDQGMSFEELLEEIESRMACLQKTA